MTDANIDPQSSTELIQGHALGPRRRMGGERNNFCADRARTAVPQTVLVPDWLLQRRVLQVWGVKASTKKAPDELRDKVRESLRVKAARTNPQVEV
jgi:hypothetical protein